MQTTHTPFDVPATAFGRTECDLPACPGFQSESLSREECSRIPALNPHHYFSAEFYRAFTLWFRAGGAEPLYISGPAGSGKTSSVMQFCARLNRPVVTVMGRARLDRRELLGH